MPKLKFPSIINGLFFFEDLFSILVNKINLQGSRTSHKFMRTNPSSNPPAKMAELQGLRSNNT